MGGLTPIVAVLVYGAVLFAIAYRFDRQGISARLSRFAFPLSLAVYCSSWTFFGGVGTAASSGWNYLSIYLGPILLFLLAPRFIARIVSLSKQVGATSVADFISARYGRGRGITAIIAVFALLASIPYIALQLRSVSSSFAVLVGLDRSWAIGPLVALLLATFSISFGARRYEVAGRNEGVVAAIAVESLIKLVTFVVLGMFALWLFLDAPPATRAAGAAALGQRLRPEGLSIEFLVQTALAASAILCLPRQFYIGIIEARDEGQVKAARWPFIAYLLVISIMVLPLALAGLTLLAASSPADLHVLNLPLSLGNGPMALLAFLGGFSASTAMVIAETIALSTMATNDLLAPLILRHRSVVADADLGRLMLTARRLIILAIIGMAFAYSTALGATQSLASIGLIAFVGVANFAPALVATVVFDFNNARAVRAGLIGGLVVWSYCLLIPSIGEYGLSGILGETSGNWLNPHALFGISLGSSIVHGSFWSLAVNIGLVAFVHFGLARSEVLAIEPVRGSFGHVTTLGELRSLVARFVGDQEAADSFDVLRIGPNPAGDPNAPIDGQAARLAERLISSVIGAPSARLIVTSTMAGAAMDVGDVVRLLDESGQNLQFSRGLLSATLQAIDLGVSVVDRNLRLVAWNPRYLEVFEYPEGYVTVGRPVADLIHYNAERGECGPGEIDAHVERRLTHLKRGLPHSFERRRPSGRWIKTVGRPMPNGGYVMSFADITAEKERQRELEARVEARTRELARINAQLDEAKTVAETATRDKTRFLAAASHDLRQPLHAARLFCSALASQVGERDKPLVGNVDHAIGAADLLLRTLLDVSRLDAGGVTPQPEHFDLGEFVRELTSEFMPLAEERRLGLHAHPGSFWTLTDRSLLRSILQNLLSNAVRYTAAGRIWIGVRRRGGRLLIEVRDSGPGIALQDQSRIFREFERLESRGSAGGGVGLGLAIVERITRLLDLPLSLRSAPGRGSTFAVSVPEGAVRPRAPKMENTATAALGGDLQGLRVLCVDDDRSVLAALDAALRSRGCETLLAGSAGEAIASAREGRPAAALIDRQLGEAEDGFDVAKALRQLDGSMLLALVTADQTIAEDPRIAALGLMLMTKPVDPDRLWAFLAHGATPSRREPARAVAET